MDARGSDGDVRIFWAVLLLAALARGGESLYELAGQVRPETAASLTLFGATSPFHAFTLSDDSGKFAFRKLEAGAYTLAVYIPARGEARQTVEVGPGTADAHGHVVLRLDLKDSDFVYGDIMRQEHSVSARELAIPDKALHEYQEARKCLGKRDTIDAVKHLEHAVEIAPQFSAAWNELGTIAYQTQQFQRAEECFREALKQDPKSYEPLVNLGGVLVTIQNLDEAWKFNAFAVLERPGDALANSQMGMTYFGMGDFDHAVKYLEKARQIDPAHFSHPQLLLAEIHLRRGEHQAAADSLEDFLRHHPDWPQAAKMRETIDNLRK
ncbi:TPR repeat-containing protein [Candidatus Sulfopaludibacter sp. SbA3]|nr:TPR repeat-containing protein [Candidatus Sulfopaludibacter sp. SbA3]